jgi:hypothetical protein
MPLDKHSLAEAAYRWRQEFGGFDHLVQAMGMSGISKNQVSRLCAEIDDKVKAFLNRPIEGDCFTAPGK